MSRVWKNVLPRKTGFKYHVDLHLEVDPEITVRASHEIAARVRDTIPSAATLGSRRAGSRGALVGLRS